MTIKTNLKLAGVAALLMALASGSQAETVNVFLDDGTGVPGSSNTDFPFSHLDRDVTWDVSSAAEPGITNIGAAVMEVRMLGIWNGSSRRMTTGAGAGVSIINELGSVGNNAYLDEQEGVVFDERGQVRMKAYQWEGLSEPEVADLLADRDEV